MGRICSLPSLAYQTRVLENLKIAKEYLEGKIMGGIMPIVSHRNAVFMEEEISGIHVDDSIIKEYKDLQKKKPPKSRYPIPEFMEKMEDSVDGFYLITPFNRVDIIQSIVREYKD